MHVLVDYETARLRQDELLREAAKDRLLRDAVARRRQRRLARLVALMASLRR